MSWQVPNELNVKGAGLTRMSARLVVALVTALNLLMIAYPQVNQSQSR
jgi:hypothetical protein